MNNFVNGILKWFSKPSNKKK